MSIDDLVDRVDRIQQGVRPIAFTVAVLKRFGEDRGSQYAALMSYYGFLSLLPLLLVLTTIAGLLLADNPELQDQVLNSVADRIPVVGTQIEQNVQGLRASGVVLVIGLLFAVFSGLGVVQVTQDALNVVWDVPRRHWPDLWHRYGRNLMVLGVLGGAVVAATVVATLSSAIELPAGADVALAVGNVVVNTVVILLAFKVLTKADLAWADLAVGALVGGVVLYVLQVVGAFYISRVVSRASDLYGTFAIVLGLVVWLNLNARVLLLAAEIDVVRHRKLWPRSISPRQLTEADHRAVEAVVAREALLDGQRIQVDFGDASAQDIAALVASGAGASTASSVEPPADDAAGGPPERGGPSEPGGAPAPSGATPSDGRDG
ncbi:MAG: YihY/virulence factor BrkB family protein [Acidimicrobiales bacterium]|nr:YihY/virulence factor BrkB family protein [Acidimicrobiales bacterium]